MAITYACPSPRGTNNAQLYLTKAGHLVDKHGRSWGRSQIQAMAQDAALSSKKSARKAAAKELKRVLIAAVSKRRLTTDEVERGETAEQMLQLRREIEKVMADMDLHDEVRRELFAILNKHVRPEEHTKRGFGPKAKFEPHPDVVGGRGAGVAGKGAIDEDDAEEDGWVEKFRRYLASRNLDDTAIEAAVAIAKRDREVPVVNAIDDLDLMPPDNVTEIDTPYSGLRPAEIRHEFWNNGPDPIKRRPDDGVSRRLDGEGKDNMPMRRKVSTPAATDAAPRASIEELIADYGDGIANARPGW
jgi:hypothetical protein